MADPQVQKQHVDFHRKVGLRKQLLRLAAPGPAYVPFCGDGDLAVQLYQDREIWAADWDPDRVETFRSRFPKAHLIQGDCNSYPFDSTPAKPFTVWDLDPYSDPYKPFRNLWETATIKKPVKLVVFFTDGHKQGVMRTGWWHHPDGSKVHLDDVNERRKVFNFYFQQTIKPWFTEYVQPYRVGVIRFYLRGMMLYWGAVIEKGSAT